MGVLINEAHVTQEVGGNLTVSYPGSLVVGEILLLTVHRVGGGSALSALALAGWTSTFFLNFSTTHYVDVLFRVVTGSEPGSETIVTTRGRAAIIEHFPNLITIDLAKAPDTWIGTNSSHSSQVAAPTSGTDSTPVDVAGLYNRIAFLMDVAQFTSAAGYAESAPLGLELLDDLVTLSYFSDAGHTLSYQLRVGATYYSSLTPTPTTAITRSLTTGFLFPSCVFMQGLSSADVTFAHSGTAPLEMKLTKVTATELPYQVNMGMLQGGKEPVDALQKQ